MLNAFIRARRPDGSECTIDLVELETALDDRSGSTYMFFPETGKIVFRPGEDSDASEGSDEGEQRGIPEDQEVLMLDSVPNHERFEWMEEFIPMVHSVTARTALSLAIRQKKPFRQFKDTLLEYPAVREQWFRFEAARFKREAVGFVESLDWEILEVVDQRPARNVPTEIDPAALLPPTFEEREWILRGAAKIAGKGGRSQLALLLKGSKDKKLLRHNLDRSPAYGRLSFLTIEEIENRIDHLIRKNELRVEFAGDFPLIQLTRPTWDQVRPWSNGVECREAAEAADLALNAILLQWCQRPRREQLYLLNAIGSLDRASALKILTAWRGLAGKEVRARIEQDLQSRSLDQ